MSDEQGNNSLLGKNILKKGELRVMLRHLLLQMGFCTDQRYGRTESSNRDRGFHPSLICDPPV